MLSEKFPYYFLNLLTGHVLKSCEMMTHDQAARDNERVKKFVSPHMKWVLDPEKEDRVERADSDYRPFILNSP